MSGYGWENYTCPQGQSISFNRVQWRGSQARSVTEKQYALKYVDSINDSHCLIVHACKIRRGQGIGLFYNMANLEI